MRRIGLILVGLILAGMAAGLLVAAAGAIPVAASSGHWAITEWFLHFTMRRSVSMRALGVEAPPLDDPALVLRGAGHYESGCAPCHGTPGERRWVPAQHMTPPPPYLPPRIAAWEAEELFWIVKHGVKFTGMPAWPAQQRDDEVWAVVAFLQGLPAMSCERYAALALGRSESGEPQSGQGNAPIDFDDVPGVVRQSCARCHGLDGAARHAGAFPRLAGQSEAYLSRSLQAYAAGERFSGIMQPIAVELDAAQIRQAAAYYAALAPPSGPAAEGGEQGAAIASKGVPEQGVPACLHCHGRQAGPRNPIYPRLTGQYADYLALQLRLFREDRRGGTAYAHLMRTIAGRLTPEQVEAVARYFGTPPGRREAP